MIFDVSVYFVATVSVVFTGLVVAVITAFVVATFAKAFLGVSVSFVVTVPVVLVTVPVVFTVLVVATIAVSVLATFARAFWFLDEKWDMDPFVVRANCRLTYVSVFADADALPILLEPITKFLFAVNVVMLYPQPQWALSMCWQ